jgi:hypothetical protein
MGACPGEDGPGPPGAPVRSDRSGICVFLAARRRNSAGVFDEQVARARPGARSGEEKVIAGRVIPSFVDRIGITNAGSYCATKLPESSIISEPVPVLPQPSTMYPFGGVAVFELGPIDNPAGPPPAPDAPQPSFRAVMS